MTQITVGSSTSYLECKQLPIMELVELHNNIQDIYEAAKPKGGGET